MRITYLIAILLFFYACTNKHVSPRILSEPEMQKVMWDIMLVEEYANIKTARDSIKNIDNDRLNLYLKVFQLHNISKEDFKASFKYYSSKPNLMKIVFDSLSARGERERRIPLHVK